MSKKDVFDTWSKNYDKDIKLSNRGYPFEGYDDTICYVQSNVSINDQEIKILDLGIGTGKLSHSLYKQGAIIYGVDSSKNMLEIAKSKMPNGLFYNADISTDISEFFKDVKFDYILSSYTFHHFEDAYKVQIVDSLFKCLSKDGKIIIADISFKTNADLELCKKKSADHWNYDEFYTCADSFITAFRNKDLDVKYYQTSMCAGVLTLSLKK